MAQINLNTDKDVKPMKPMHAYYSLAAFNRLYRLGTQVEAVCDTEELYVLAASNGKNHAMMISNLTESEQELTVNGADLSEARYYVIDQERLLSWSPDAKVIKNNETVLIEWQE